MMLKVWIHILVQKRLLPNIGKHEISCRKWYVLIFTSAYVILLIDSNMVFFDLSTDFFELGRVFIYILSKAAVDAIIIVYNTILQLRDVVVRIHRITRHISSLPKLRNLPTEKWGVYGLFYRTKACSRVFNHRSGQFTMDFYALIIFNLRLSFGKPFAVLNSLLRFLRVHRSILILMLRSEQLAVGFARR